MALDLDITVFVSGLVVFYVIAIVLHIVVRELRGIMSAFE